MSGAAVDNERCFILIMTTFDAKLADCGDECPYVWVVR
jgi:hypothetical protein